MKQSLKMEMSALGWQGNMINKCQDWSQMRDKNRSHKNQSSQQVTNYYYYFKN